MPSAALRSRTADLICSLFNRGDELRSFLSFNIEGGQDVAQSLPDDLSLKELSYQSVDLLQSRGLVDTAFQAWEQEYPQRKEEIHALRVEWQQELASRSSSLTPRPDPAPVDPHPVPAKWWKKLLVAAPLALTAIACTFGMYFCFEPVQVERTATEGTGETTKSGEEEGDGSTTLEVVDAAPVIKHDPPSPEGTRTLQLGDEVYEIQQGEPGEPAVVGCADGQREALLSVQQFPAVAGCQGSWETPRSLRGGPGPSGCGDDYEYPSAGKRGRSCTWPRDLCAEGWEICAYDGSFTKLRGRLSAGECRDAGDGRFYAAASHCLVQEDSSFSCKPGSRYPCNENGHCAEPVCCGRGCRGEPASCKDAVWGGATPINGNLEGCAYLASPPAGGVLCCKT